MDRSLFFITVLFVAGCAPSKTPVDNHPKDTSMDTSFELDIQGHRGARGLLPENTIPAFERALELGVTTLEMDVVITKDKQVVVSHEPWFSGHICSLPSGEPVPMETARDHKIFELTYEEVKQYDCGIRGNVRFPQQQKMRVFKPLLEDVITFAEKYQSDRGLSPVLYNIETKSTPEGDDLFHPGPEEFTNLLIEVLESTNILDRATIQSFDPRTLVVANQANPDISLALLVEGHEEMGFAGHVENLGFDPDIYSPYYKLVDEELIAEAHARNIKVIPWTINTLEEMETLVKIGVDGIITDYPDIGMALVKDEN